MNLDDIIRKLKKFGNVEVIFSDSGDDVECTIDICYGVYHGQRYMYDYIGSDCNSALNGALAKLSNDMDRIKRLIDGSIPYKCDVIGIGTAPSLLDI